MKKTAQFLIFMMLVFACRTLFAAEDTAKKAKREAAVESNIAEEARTQQADGSGLAGAGRSYLIKRVVFKGRVQLSDESLAVLTGALEGKKISTEKLEPLKKLLVDYYASNGYPDTRVSVSLEEIEEGTLIITIKEAFPFHASYEFNRRGSKYTHRARHILHLGTENLLGVGDSLKTSLTLAEQDAVIGGTFDYSVPLKSTGTVFYLNASVFRSRLQKELRALNVESRSYSLVPGIRQHIWNNDKGNLDWNLQFEYKNNKTTVAGSKLFYDRMRVITTGPRASLYDDWGLTSADADIHIGLPGFMGGSDNNDIDSSRVASGGNFVYWTGRMERLQKLPFDSLLALRLSGQVSTKPLTVLEQMYLGGMYSVRGYTESEAGGDQGYNFSAEWRIPPYVIPKDAKIPGMENKTWRESLTLYTFLDGGKVFNYKRQFAGQETSRFLLGTGFGARFYISPEFNIQFDLGIPVGDPNADSGYVQAHLLARIGI